MESAADDGYHQGSAAKDEGSNDKEGDNGRGHLAERGEAQAVLVRREPFAGLRSYRRVTAAHFNPPTTRRP